MVPYGFPFFPFVPICFIFSIVQCSMFPMLPNCFYFQFFNCPFCYCFQNVLCFQFPMFHCFNFSFFSKLFQFFSVPFFQVFHVFPSVSSFFGGFSRFPVHRHEILIILISESSKTDNSASSDSICCVYDYKSVHHGYRSWGLPSLQASKP